VREMMREQRIRDKEENVRVYEMFVCSCFYECTCVCVTYACMCECVCIYIHVYVHVHVHMYVYERTYVPVF
jgi:hypothetical protein